MSKYLGKCYDGSRTTHEDVAMVADARIRAKIHRRPLDGLLTRVRKSDDIAPDFDFSTPIDRSRLFVCPTLTPLYYAPIYRQLDESHQRRYNQLAAICFSELIGFFETTFAASVLAALANSRRHGVDRALVDCLEGFLAEERRHTEWWRRMNRLSEPELYANSDQAMIRLPAATRFVLRQLTSHPYLFPMVFWVMLALEERSLEISRRCMRLRVEQIEPRYLAVYRAHLAHEVQHVQIDWHLIERFYAKRSSVMRQLNARLFQAAIRHFFLPPTRSTVRVVSRLVVEHPALAPLSSTMKRQLHQVGHDPAYHEMMYSRKSTPITFELFDCFPEFHAMRRLLHSYQPQSNHTS
jgi:P-aminobenzoate N-oxygenase AurF